jgi:hypothetical protein
VFLSALGNERTVAILITRHIETDQPEFCVYFSGSAISENSDFDFSDRSGKEGSFRLWLSNPLQSTLYNPHVLKLLKVPLG